MLFMITREVIFQNHNNKLGAKALSIAQRALSGMEPPHFLCPFTLGIKLVMKFKLMTFGKMQEIKNNKKSYITINYSGDKDHNNI